MHSPSSETSSVTSHDVFSMSSYANSSAVDSSMNYQKCREGGRAKWGSYLFDSFAKDNGRCSRNTNGPVWLEKSLSEARDSEEETMSISVRSVASFIRGQNVPLDPQVLAERESKRRKAMELQHAIKEQLAERENLKKIEREKLFQFEKREEERLAKQVDMERKRVEQEQNLQFEKLENERKKEEQMRRALEKAALEAQMDREKKRRERIALQNAIDETISIQKIGEKTEIFLDQKSRSGFNTPKPFENNDSSIISQTPPPESNIEDDEDADDGETVLIGTPIKLKKKNLETFRRKFHKRQQNVEDARNTSDDEVSTPKTSKSGDSNSEKNNANPSQKVLSELDSIALVLQSMPMVPFVPYSNELFNFSQFNNLALLMAAQTRLTSPNMMLPIISKDMTTASMKPNEKLDLSQFILPQNNQQTITLHIQQVDSNQNVKDCCEAFSKLQPVPATPDQNIQKTTEAQTSPIKLKTVEVLPRIDDKSLIQPATKTTNEQLNQEVPNLSATPLPHDGTFTKEECHTHDAFTSTSTESRFVDEEREVKILTPQKYRNGIRFKDNAKTIGTQTESFLFCEYCSYHHQHNHHHQCSGHPPEETDAVSKNTQQEVIKSKEKKNAENRPLWGARNPPVKYIKASERDPFYGKNRKKRYLKKALSESEKTDDSCIHRDCPLIKSPTPLLPKRYEKLNRDNLCKNMLPIKYDRFGRICLMDEQNFIYNEAYRRIPKFKSDLYTSDAESSIDIKHKSFFLPKANDFQDIFVD